MKLSSFVFRKAVLAAIIFFLASSVSVAYAETADEVLKRVQRGAAAENPDPNAKNQYRGGVSGIPEVIKNMKDIAKPIWPDAPGSEVDKWYSPHLRDQRFVPELRNEQASFRARALVARIKPCFFWIPSCVNGFGVNQTACNNWLCQIPGCNLPWEHLGHLEEACCKPFVAGSMIYSKLVDDTNFKTCCVREGEESWTEEKLACTYPTGDGWAGMFEYYYPTTIVGIEKQRAETMIATKSEVADCLAQSDKIMDKNGVDWVAGAIKRISDVSKAKDGEYKSVDTKDLKQRIAEDFDKVRTKNEELKAADSIFGEGLTARPFLPAYSRSEMTRLAEYFCMHPRQFHKLMDPSQDLLQLRGGPSPEALADQTSGIKIWANYCPDAVELMTNPENTSTLKNIDLTDSDFNMGFKAWTVNKLYCQWMHLRNNPSVNAVGIGDMLKKTGEDPGFTAAQVGYMCSDYGDLSTGMSPLTLYRTLPVLTRTAIKDRMLSFVMAGALWPALTNEPRSQYKRFEPQPYSQKADEKFQTFWGNPFVGGGVNELGKDCRSLKGDNFALSQMNNAGNSDQLFISDYTHKSFTQEPIRNINGGRKAFDKYVTQWAKNDDQSKADIDNRGMDKDAHTYGVTFRIFATCPSGFKRWRPTYRWPGDDVQMKNLDTNCGEENFGSPKAHGPGIRN